MKKVGIVTIIDNNNYGNRLQNYASQEILKEINCYPITLKNNTCTNTKDKYYLRKIKHMFDRKYSSNRNRRQCFKDFNKHINFSQYILTAVSNKEKCDYYIVGSDQVWNPFLGRMKEIDLLSFAEDKKRIAFSASFSVDNIPQGEKQFLKNELRKFNCISVREQKGKEIIEDLKIDKKVEVLLDPTLLVNEEIWTKVYKKPKFGLPKKYILNYFLGELSEKRKKEIERIAKSNDCEIINILDLKDKCYETGPSEFLYLEKNAFLVCTDSFHSCVFAMIFNRPFVVFDREQKNIKNMNSRIDTLLKKFKLEKQRYYDQISEEQLKVSYEKSREILEEEREKALKFLINAIK